LTLKKHIICFGDSNTHGYCADPNDCADGALFRFNEDERWTKLLQRQLGEDYLVVEEGLSGRTTVFDDPLTEGLSALSYITPCLKSHEPVSLLILMLGTNDSKERFGCTAACIGQGMQRLIRKAQATDCWGSGSPNILVVCPPPIGAGIETTEVFPIIGAGCVEKSRALSTSFQTAAELTGSHFFDAKDCEFNQIDYMHLTRRGHAQLADALSQLVPTLL
jgi:lysophospholipase L1-like esterase